MAAEAGDAFVEHGFILGEPHGATAGDDPVLCFTTSQFERMFGKLGTWQSEHYLQDPRLVRCIPRKGAPESGCQYFEDAYKGGVERYLDRLIKSFLGT